MFMTRRPVNRFERVGKLGDESFFNIIDGLNSVQKMKTEGQWEFAKMNPWTGEAIGRLQIKNRPWLKEERKT